MKVLLFWVIGVLVGYWAVFISLVLLTPAGTNSSLFCRDNVFDVSVKLFPGFATFLAVCVSLFGSALIKRFKKPCLKLNIACDDVHCVLSENDDGMMADTVVKKMQIFVSVKNTSDVDAIDSQLVCNRAFISKDGEKFVQFQTFRAASFRWLYSSDDAQFLTTLRKSVEKYAALFEIIERKEMVSEDGKIDKVNENKKQLVQTTSLAICLPVKKEEYRTLATNFIEIPPEYRAILLPVCLASSSTDPVIHYVKLYWRGNSLESFPTKDRLELKCLTKQEAQDAVEVRLD